MKSQRHIVQIVPKLPPAVDGIGDYAAVLGTRFRECGCDVSSIICTPDAPSPSQEMGAYAILTARDTVAFCNALNSLQQRDLPVHLVVHFAPYAYQKRGVPFWLLSALNGVRSRGSVSISVIYHELNASSDSWLKSAFWLAPVQRHLVARMRKLADFEYTNTHDHVDRLMKLGSRSVHLATNVSTVGEPDQVPMLSDRYSQLVIFGRAAMKAVTYSSGLDNLRRACEAISATQILDIGSPAENTPDRMHDIPIVQKGRLDAVEVSSVLCSSKAMYLSYPLELLGKSSVFAAARAHGTIPLVHNEHGTGRDDTFLVGTDYFEIKEGAQPPQISLMQSQIIAYRYAESNSSRLALAILSGLEQS